MVDAPVYLVHLSCEEALQALNDARGRGQTVFGETRPLYLHLTREAYESEDFPERYTCWPPLREADQVEIIWQALESDVLQTVATDHIAWSKAQKLHGQRVNEYLPGHGEPRDAAADALLGRRAYGASEPQPLRGGDLGESREALRPLPEEGHDRGGLRRRHRRVRSRKEGCHPAVRDALAAGLGAARRLRGDGLAGADISRGEIIVEDRQLLAAPGRGQLVKRKTFGSI